MAAQTQLTKMMVSEIFGVTRSAVTQSTKSKSLLEDVKSRIIRFLFDDRKVVTYHWSERANRNAKELLAICRLVMSARKMPYSGNGRPVSTLDFTLFKRLVRQILAQYDEWNECAWDLVEDAGGFCPTYKGSTLQKVLYILNKLCNKAWSIASVPDYVPLPVIKAGDGTRTTRNTIVEI